MKVSQLTITGLATAALVAGGLALAGLGLAVYPVEAKSAPLSADEWCPRQSAPLPVNGDCAQLDSAPSGDSQQPTGVGGCGA